MLVIAVSYIKVVHNAGRRTSNNQSKGSNGTDLDLAAKVCFISTVSTRHWQVSLVEQIGPHCHSPSCMIPDSELVRKAGPHGRSTSQRCRPVAVPVAIQQYRGNAGQAPPPSSSTSDQFISSQGPLSSTQSVDAQPRRATATSATGRQQWESQGAPERQRYEVGQSIYALGVV